MGWHGKITDAAMEDFYSNHCVDGKCTHCGECCADLLPLTVGELERIRRYVKKHKIKEHRQAPFYDRKATDLTCPFRNQQTKRCDIYPRDPTSAENSSAARKSWRPTRTGTRSTRAGRSIPSGGRSSRIRKACSC